MKSWTATLISAFLAVLLVMAGCGTSKLEDPPPDTMAEAAPRTPSPDQEQPRDTGAGEPDGGQDEEQGESEEAVDPEPYTQSLAVHFIDVGQGDAILIETRPGLIVLIDGGTRTAGRVVVDYLVARGIREIDIVIATHPHADHIGGLIEVLRSFTVHRVIDSGVPHTTATYRDFLLAVEAQPDTLYEFPENQVIQLSDSVTLSILGPDQPFSSINDNSVVCRVDFGSTSFLFTGDAEHAAEARLLARGVNLNADVLKVGHHGSRTSTTQAFLDAVGPDHAVIQVGAGNTYGHPADETLIRLEAAGAEVYRNDIHGHIVFESSGTAIMASVSPWINEPSSSEGPQDPGAEPNRYVGSTRSDRYHHPTCRHAETILPHNERWFSSAAEALQAGYEPCGGCAPPRWD